MTERRKRILSAGGLLLPTLLTSCDLSSDFANVAEGLLPNLWITLTQIVLFVATAAAVIFLAYKPLKKKLEKRKDYIEGNIRDSERKKADATKALDEAKEAVDAAQKKAGDIIREAQKTAELKAADEQKALSASIEKQKIQAHKDIEAERARMLASAHNQILETALSASKEILGREVDSEDNRKLVDQFIDDLAEENKA